MRIVNGFVVPDADSGTGDDGGIDLSPAEKNIIIYGGPDKVPFGLPGSTKTSPDGDEPQSQEEINASYGRDPDAWRDTAMSAVYDSLEEYGKKNGWSPEEADTYWFRHGNDLFDSIERRLLTPGDELKNSLPSNIANMIPDFVAGDRITLGRDYYQMTPEGLNELIDFSIDFFGNATGFSLRKAPPSSGGAGSGRRGSAGLTPEEIRNQFDIDELSRTVDDMNRGLVLESHNDPTSVARAYVEEVVRSKGEVKIDFANYVERSIERTARYKSIYKNKPDSLTALQYMQPYHQTALGISPDEGEAAAIGGAQFGSSQAQFGERLKRTDAVTGSAPYIQGLEQRMGELNSILRG